MRLLTAGTIKAHAARHPGAAQALADWCAVVKAARWTAPLAMQTAYGRSARPISDERVIFEICGNKFRLVVAVRWATEHADGVVFVKFFGTHAEYNRIDALTVEPAKY